MMNLENIKIGEELLVGSCGMYVNESVEVVERITKTLVITNKHRFNKNTGHETGNSWVGNYVKGIATQFNKDDIQWQKDKRNLLYKLRTLAEGNSDTVLKNLNEVVRVSTLLQELLANEPVEETYNEDA